MGVKTNDPLLGPAVACVETFYARLFRDWPEAVNQQADDYMLSFSGDRRLTGANHLWPYHADALTEETLAAAQAFFENLGAAWSVVIVDTFMPAAPGLLTGYGYHARWSSPLMVLDEPPRRLETNPGAPVIHATTPEQLEDVKRVMSEAFANGTSVNRRVVRPEHGHAEGLTHYLIYQHGEPVACATAALCGTMAGVWNVGTRYAFRRQRFATTIMLALLDEVLAQGCDSSMLMASPEGQYLYRQLGYRQIGTTIYMGPPYVARTRYA